MFSSRAVSGSRTDLTVFNEKRGWQIGVLSALFTAMLVAGYLFHSLSQMAAAGDVAVFNDFRVFWAAAKLTLEGNSLAIFDNDAMADIHGVARGRWIPWLYPPGYLTIVTPLGFLSFGLAWIVFTILSFVVIGLAMRPFTNEAFPLWLACVFSPAYLPAILVGQNSLLWLAGLLAALWALREEKYVLAGLFIGLLTLKPQLGLLIPVALFAIGAWRTIFTAIATTILVALIPTFFYGIDYWVALHQNLQAHSGVITSHMAELDFMLSTHSHLIALGIPAHTAIYVQWAMLLTSVAVVFWVWRMRDIEWDTKCAVLITFTAIATPYFWHYETGFLVPIALFMLRSGLLKAKMPDLILLVLLWIGLGPVMLLLFLGYHDMPAPRYFFTPLMLVTAMVCIFRIQKQRTASPGKA